MILKRFKDFMFSLCCIKVLIGEIIRIGMPNSEKNFGFDSGWRFGLVTTDGRDISCPIALNKLLAMG